MENKHTPGPWDNDGRGVITGGKYLATTIAETPKCRWVANERFEVAEEAEANARLIAACPDLLAALEPLSAWAENERRRHRANNEDNEAEYMGALADAARSALAKARGE